MPEPSHITLGSVARILGCSTWQVRRLFERGLLPPAPRVGMYRIVAVADLPLVKQALKAAGYIGADEQLQKTEKLQRK